MSPKQQSRRNVKSVGFHESNASNNLIQNDWIQQKRTKVNHQGQLDNGS
jgi:hypothetical protein